MHTITKIHKEKKYIYTFATNVRLNIEVKKLFYYFFMNMGQNTSQRKIVKYRNAL